MTRIVWAKDRRAMTQGSFDWRFWLWNQWAQIKHVLRVHTFVALEEWDPEADAMQYIGEICWVCEARR
jgi:hypothetical protein